MWSVQPPCWSSYMLPSNLDRITVLREVGSPTYIIDFKESIKGLEDQGMNPSTARLDYGSDVGA